MSGQNKRLTFELLCEEKQAFLVARREHDGASLVQIIPMDNPVPGVWRAHIDLLPGTNRFRYYGGDNRFIVFLGPASFPGSREDGWDAIFYVEERETRNEVVGSAASQVASNSVLLEENSRNQEASSIPNVALNLRFNS